MKKEHLLIFLLFVILGLITFLHYNTHPDDRAFQETYRRLYYLPIIIAAFSFGIKGALASVIFVVFSYIPYEMLYRHEIDVANRVENIFEIVLFFAVGIITGFLVDRMRREQRKQTETARDLTKTLEEVNSMKQQLVLAEKMSALGQLSAGLAHEIRNPLSSIKGSADILTDFCEPGSDKHKFIEIMKRETERLDNIIERFLQFARPKPMNPTLIQVDEVISEVIKITQAQANKIRISPHLDIQCPMCRVDSYSLKQVLINIVLNAVQAIEPDRGEVTVSSTTKQHQGQDYVCITVLDDGPGIPEDELSEIFNPFFTTKEEGTGLGLSISHRIIEEIGGFITVKSSPGRTEFSVMIPCGHEHTGGE